MEHRWERPGIPHKGWKCVDVIDLNPDNAAAADTGYETCEMCGKHPIRYVHVMTHTQHPETMHVGCVCAEKLCHQYDGKSAEKRLRRKAQRRKNWLDLSWRESKNGNPYLKKDGLYLTVFPDKFREGYWVYSVDGEFSDKKYPSAEEACMALFEAYWEVIDR